MAPNADPDRLRLAAQGAALTAAVTATGVVTVGLVSLWRCGGLFGESTAVPGTLSERLCADAAGRVAFAIVVAAPLAAGLAGTAAAVAARDARRLRAPLAVAAAVPLVTAVVYLLSGSL